MQIRPTLSKSEELLHNYDRQSTLVSRWIIGALVLMLLVLIAAHAYFM